MTLNNKVKENIILTTVQNVWTKGYSLTSVQDIIKKAKAPKGSVYYYFPKGKDEIYLEALDKINSNVKKEFKTISPKLGTLEEYLTAVFDLFISKGKACKRSGFSLTLLAMETAELSPIIAENAVIFLKIGVYYLLMVYSIEIYQKMFVTLLANGYSLVFKVH